MAAIFRPIWPLLPMPVTMTRPRQLRRISIAWAKLSMRSPASAAFSALRPSASSCRVRVAEAMVWPRSSRNTRSRLRPIDMIVLPPFVAPHPTLARIGAPSGPRTDPFRGRAKRPINSIASTLGRSTGSDGRGPKPRLAASPVSIEVASLPRRHTISAAGALALGASCLPSRRDPWHRTRRCLAETAGSPTGGKSSAAGSGAG